MGRPISRGRRPHVNPGHPLLRLFPALLVGVALLGGVLAAGVMVARTLNFMHKVTGRGASSVVQVVQNAVAPPPGSLAYKLQGKQPVTILVLGVGGDENDAPNLSDTMMAVTLDPRSRRVVQVSVPRDLWVSIDAWTDGRSYSNKINVANEIGSDDTNQFFPCCKRAEFAGRDGGGHLAEAAVGRVTGLRFDRYVTVDFKAFRDIVDALGGVDVVLDTALDDCHYPDYHNGYINGGVPPGEHCPPGSGIHFPAGPQHLDGERALQLARSRDADQPEQATDFGRARRQQAIVQAIRRRAASVNAITRLPELMDAVQRNVRTDMDVNDIKAVYDWSAGVPDTAFVKVALTNADLLDDHYLDGGSCGDPDAYVLCPLDPSFGYLRYYLSRLLVPKQVSAEGAPVQLLNATGLSDDVDVRVTNSLRPLGLRLADAQPIRPEPAGRTRILDYSNGQFPRTANWLSSYFRTPVEATGPPEAPGAAPPAGAAPSGLVVVLGGDFAQRFYGREQ